MSTPQQRRRRRLAYIEQYGLCYYCGRAMIYYDRVPLDKTTLPRLCTLEHLRDKHHPRRGMTPRPGERCCVAACYKCNQEQARGRKPV